jgi:hypothetical protein
LTSSAGTWATVVRTSSRDRSSRSSRCRRRRPTVRRLELPGSKRQSPGDGYRTAMVSLVRLSTASEGMSRDAALTLQRPDVAGALGRPRRSMGAGHAWTSR